MGPLGDVRLLVPVHLLAGQLGVLPLSSAGLASEPQSAAPLAMVWAAFGRRRLARRIRPCPVGRAGSRHLLLAVGGGCLSRTNLRCDLRHAGRRRLAHPSSGRLMGVHHAGPDAGHPGLFLHRRHRLDQRHGPAGAQGDLRRRRNDRVYADEPGVVDRRSRDCSQGRQGSGKLSCGLGELHRRLGLTGWKTAVEAPLNVARCSCPAPPPTPAAAPPGNAPSRSPGRARRSTNPPPDPGEHAGS